MIHQFSKIGRLVMVGGNSRVNMDLPPFFLYSDFNATPIGLNLVGIRRSGLPASEVASLKTAYNLLYRSGLKLEDAVAAIEKQVPGQSARHLTTFIRSSKRGIARE